MTDSDSAATDEQLLRSYASHLADLIDEALAPWTIRSVRVGCERSGIPFDARAESMAVDAGSRCHDEVAPRIRALLASDLDAQRATPLSLVRGAVRFPTEVLVSLGAATVDRDEFDERAFPDDVYGLAPASFADIDESLVEPGIVWGAAKAHVHRSRHRPDP